MHGWNDARERGRGEPYYEVVALLVAAGTRIEPQWIATDESGQPERCRPATRACSRC
jgi:hypothetical protein